MAEDAEDLVSFGAWVRLRRQALVLSRAELAARVGVAEVTIRKIEADERKPSPQVASLLAVQLQLASDERELFVRAGRGVLAAHHLPPPIPGRAPTATPVLPPEPALAVPSLRARAVEQRTGRLPAPVNQLIGRVREVAELTQLLEADARLITLTGPGGTGKTRLALQLAYQLIGDHFPDGVWFVDLAPVSEPEQIAAAIAQVLAIPESPARSITDALLAWVSERRLLLLLDNCEQVADGAATLASRLLRAAPSLKLLATSRVPLRIAGEREYLVAPLAVPGADVLLAPEQLDQYDAVRLFVVRAGAVRANFRLTEANAAAVAAICARLDGLPLAIELAAARVRLFRPEHLLVRLSSTQLHTLTTGARDLPARQQTMRATIDWSYRLLSESQQILLARLGVFVGGWTLAAAETVCGDEQAEVAEELEALVAHSLVRVGDPEAAVGGETRYTMLETIREYALERLDERGERERLQRRHAEYFTELAELADARLRYAAQSLWLDRLDAEHDNLRAALSWSLHGAAAELGGRLTVALAGGTRPTGFWLAHGHSNEQRRWLRIALDVCRSGSPTLRAQLLTRALVVTHVLFEEAEQQDAMYAEALALFRRAGDLPGVATTLMEQGTLRFYSGRNYPEAVRQIEHSLALFRESGDRYGTTSALHQLGDIAREQGDLEGAAALLQESITIMREIDINEAKLAMALNGLGDVVHAQGDDMRAAALYWEALDLVQQVGDRWHIIWPLRNLAHLALMHGDDGRLLMLLEAHITWCHEKHVAGAESILHLLGSLVGAQGDHARAKELLREALVLQRELGHTAMVEESLAECARLAARQGWPIWPARFLGASGELSGKYGQLRETVREQCDPAAFEAAWHAGRALSWEQAADEALTWLGAEGGASPQR